MTLQERGTVDGVRYTFRPVDEWNTGSVAAWDGNTVVGRMEFGYPATDRQRGWDVVAGWCRVNDRYRGRGIGTRLLVLFLEWADGRAVYAEFTDAGRGLMAAVRDREYGGELPCRVRGFSDHT